MTFGGTWKPELQARLSKSLQEILSILMSQVNRSQVTHDPCKNDLRDKISFHGECQYVNCPLFVLKYVNLHFVYFDKNGCK